jgi:flagellar basal body P-ring formation protein FlgA
LFVKALVIAAGLSAGVAAAADTTTSVTPDAVTAAIAQAAEARLGKDATVSVWQVTGVRLNEEADLLIAVPDPSARIGAPARFVLSVQRKNQAIARVGEATATIQVVGPAVRTTRAVNRGERLAAGDVATVSSDWIGRPLRPLPTLEQSLGARVTRDLAMNTVLAGADIAAEPLVRAGETVRAHARIGAVDITAQLVAVESGLRDETIRVINKDTRRALRARVIGNSEVEVIDVPE